MIYQTLKPSTLAPPPSPPTKFIAGTKISILHLFIVPVFIEEDEELIELQEENTNVQLAEEELLAIGIVFYSHFVLLKIEWGPPSWSPLKL